MPEENPRDPSTWVQRREDPRFAVVERDIRSLKWLAPVSGFVTTAVVVTFGAGVTFALWRANQVTRQQFEREQSERRDAETKTRIDIAKLEGKIDTLILMQQQSKGGKR